jgi:hypothetical protein
VRTIEVDFDVYKALTLRRPTESVTENDVLRELLGLPRAAHAQPSAISASAVVTVSEPGAWITKGVRFPAGTEFRAHYKGETHLARVQNSALLVNGQRYDTPSAAAMAITGSPVNGWTFWECRLPGQAAWQMIKALRKSAR